MTGLADALMMTGLRYGSEEAARQASQWMAEISHAAYVASTLLAFEATVEAAAQALETASETASQTVPARG